ncbi:MAG: hypothetical protein AMXMBFR64_12420 [Myxococcales bacterium]
MPATTPPDRRDEILDAALDCFVTHGYHGTAVPTVAKRAGVAAGTLYHYFPSKEVMVNAVYRKWKGVIAQRVFAGFPAGASPREQFRAMWREMVAFALAHPKAFAFLELHHHASYLDATSLGLENTLKSFGAAMVERAQAEGQIKPGPPALLMELVFGAFIGMMRAHWEGRVALTEDDRELAERACWDTVALHGQGGRQQG